MTWNGPIEGDYTNVDFGKAPWTQEVMALSHDECMHVKDKFEEIITTYDPNDNWGSPITDSYIYIAYNNSDWTYAINTATQSVINAYNPEINTLGINESGIIQPEPEPEPEPEEPIEEPTEEPPAEVVDEPTEETVTE
jgi:hypothetical protein